jgi:uncharacterized protein (DUF2461 family)
MTSSRKKANSGDQAAESFTGFTPKALQFFHDLARYQDRQWFEQQKPVYEKEVVRPM